MDPYLYIIEQNKHALNRINTHTFGVATKALGTRVVGQRHRNVGSFPSSVIFVVSKTQHT